MPHLYPHHTPKGHTMTEHTEMHVELRDRFPIAWIARLTNTSDGPQLLVTRIDLDLPEADGQAAAQFFTPPTAGDGFQLVDVDAGQRIAFLQTAQLRPEVDPDRPVLQLTAVATSAFVQPDWPFVFGSYLDSDPLAGVYVSINTPREVVLGWVEASVLRPGSLTVDDVLGGPR